MDDHGYGPRPKRNPGSRRGDRAGDSGDGGGHRAPVAATWSRRAVLVPSATLLLGFILGAALMGLVGGSPGHPPKSEVSVTATPSTTVVDPEDAAVVVPPACVRAAESVQQATSVLRDGIASLRDFRGRELVEALDELEDLENQAGEQAAACVAVDVVTLPEEESSSPSAEDDGDTSTTDATATPSPESSPTSSPNSSPRPRRSR